MLVYLLATRSDLHLQFHFSTRALSAAGMLRLVGKVENVITKQVTQKMPETDAWFEDRAASVENLQVD